MIKKNFLKMKIVMIIFVLFFFEKEKMEISKQVRMRFCGRFNTENTITV